MSGLAWSKFYWSDWAADPLLRACSLEAQGLWMRILCVCAEAEDGSAAVNGQPLTDEKFARIIGTSVKTFRKLVAELSENGVLSFDQNGAIFSRRMRRESEKRKQDQENGRMGGNPSLRGGVNPRHKGRLKAQKPEARSQREREAPIGLPLSLGASAPRDEPRADAAEGESGSNVVNLEARLAWQASREAILNGTGG